MPLPSFVNSLASKAQSTIQQHIPQAGLGRPASPDSAPQPSANEAAAGGHKSHTFGSLQHQFRTFQQQYATTTPVQKIVTSGKGLAIDFDSASRDAKAQSKELYTWGQTEANDLKDVTDRLAYLNFVHGTVAAELSTKLDSSRTSLKALRDAETAILPRRNVRAGLNGQLTKVEYDQVKGMERKIAELKEQIAKAESDDAPQEREIEVLKRKAVKESEQAKWDAIREYGEKLVLLSQAAARIVPVLPSVPPSAEHPYAGAETTASARVTLQTALDSYKPGQIHLPDSVKGAELNRHDTRSFGQTHASELSSLNSQHESSVTGIPLSPPTELNPLVDPAKEHVAPIDTHTLNQAPALIPPSPMSTQSNVPMKDVSFASASSSHMDSSLPPDNIPTVAETGVPVTATSGPATGSLLKSEKHETAEEEKKRLEREEVDRTRMAVSDEKKGGEDDLPPYQEM